ncbi:MAG: J domain-containing protein [Acidobacteria bacterium]|nr:J domain-containing protein [Acidobacteriota bacterium]
MQIVKIALQGPGGRVLDTKGELISVRGDVLTLRTAFPIEVGSSAYISGGGVKNLAVQIGQCALEGADQYRVECRTQEGSSPNRRANGGDPDVEDYYAVLEVSPTATSDTISRVYRALAHRFHPDNAETGDPEQFSKITEAYSVLSNSTKRAAYDVKYESAKALRWKIFETPDQAKGVEAEKAKRNGILGVLYRRLLATPWKPEVMRRHIEELLGCPSEQLEASFWYLIQKKFIVQGDGGSYRITHDGMDAFEASGAHSQPERALLEEARPTRDGEVIVAQAAGSQGK